LILRKLVAILPVDDAVIAQALDSAFSDFEDAIQYHVALTIGVEVIITRNTRDYINAAIPVMTAGEYLAHLDE
jgi:predicted nucleic acid-binding protein